MSEATTRDHRNLQPAGRRQRSNHQRRLVTAPTGGMLVDCRTVESVGTNSLPTGGHGRDQPGGLFGIQAIHGYGHEHGGQLLDGPVARRGALDELLDVCSPKLLARSFASDDFDSRHLHRPDTHLPACPVDRRRWQRSDIIDPRVVEGELLVDLYRQVAHGRNSEVDTLVLTSAAGKNILI